MNKVQERALCGILLACLGGSALAQMAQNTPAPADRTSSADKQNAAAARHVNEAVAVARKLELDPRIQPVLAAAKGVFIVPSYGRAALGVGAAGGTGILLAHRPNGGWAAPVFYNTGGLSVGLQAGAQGGSLVLVLNNDKAVDEFLKKNNFSLNAKTGFTVLAWNKMAQGAAGSGDVIAWSDTKGLFGDVVTFEINDIRFNQAMTNAYYHHALSASDVIDGPTENPQAELLVKALVAAAGPVR